MSLITYHFSHSKSGFTLLEIVVAMSIISVVATIASASLFSMLKGAAKSDVLKEVKQNGDYALSVMEIKIRNARRVVSTCTGVSATSLQIENQDSSTTTFACASGRITQTTGATTTYLTNTTVLIPANCIGNFSFTCSTGADTRTKSIAISFNLAQANSSAPTFETASQTFSTQVGLRNK